MIKKEKVYTEQQTMFLDALPSCKGKIRAAMDIAGFSKATPERYIINLLHEEIVEIANKLLASAAVEAAVALVGVFDEPEKLGNSHTINAAKEVLDRGGVLKKSNDEVAKDNGGGILILPAKKTKITIENDE